MEKNHSSNLKVPGPGTYNVKSPTNTTNTVIGDAQRFKYEKSQVPGPGAYR
jgi:hypothetical protein